MTVRRYALRLYTVLALTLATFLSQPARAGNEPMRAGDPAQREAARPAPPAVPAGHGKVLETMNAGSYTYARVETASGEHWLAGPQATVKVGDTVSWPSGMEMKNFKSPTLGRTFDSILFVDALSAGAPGNAGGAAGAHDSGAAAGGHGAAGAAGAGNAAPASPSSPHEASPHGSMSGKAADDAPITGIAKADGGQTVAEIYAQKARLEGKEVVVRGKVVKANNGVMGRNWLHLRDGTHSEAGENDLTVTTPGSANVGDVVIVRGKVVLNKDFGFNYKYDVMLEDATVTVEKGI